MTVVENPNYILPLIEYWESLAIEDCPPGEDIEDFRLQYVAARLRDLKSVQERNGTCGLLEDITDKPHGLF